MRNQLLFWSLLILLNISVGCDDDDISLPCEEPTNLILNSYTINGNPSVVNYQWDSSIGVDSSRFHLTVFSADQIIIQEIDTILFSNNVTVNVQPLAPDYKLEAELSNYCDIQESNAITLKEIIPESDCQSPEELGIISYNIGGTEEELDSISYAWSEPVGVDSFHFILTVINADGGITQEIDTIITTPFIDLNLLNLTDGTTLIAQVSSVCNGEESSPPTEYKTKVSIVIDDVVMGLNDPDFDNCCPNCPSESCLIKFGIDEVVVDNTGYNIQKYKTVNYPLQDLCTCKDSLPLSECLQITLNEISVEEPEIIDCQ